MQSGSWYSTVVFEFVSCELQITVGEDTGGSVVDLRVNVYVDVWRPDALLWGMAVMRSLGGGARLMIRSLVERVPMNDCHFEDSPGARWG